jgi:hypothetical protein
MLFLFLVDRPDAYFLEACEQFGCILIHAIGTYLFQFFFPIASGEQSDAETSCPAGR